MTHQFFGYLTIAFLLTATATIATADDAKDEAIKKERSLYHGTWRIATLEVNGSKATDEDIRKFRVVNGDDGTWSVQSEGKDISKGISTIDPTTTPKTIDFTPTEGGGKDKLHLGIYEISENTRKLCFAPPEMDRPTEFSSTPDNKYILVTFERLKAE